MSADKVEREHWKTLVDFGWKPANGAGYSLHLIYAGSWRCFAKYDGQRHGYYAIAESAAEASCNALALLCGEKVTAKEMAATASTAARWEYKT